MILALSNSIFTYFNKLLVILYLIKLIIKLKFVFLFLLIFRAFLKIEVSKQPTYPLRLFKTTNVRVSGVTESSGTSYLDNTYSKVISFFSLTLSQ